MAKSEADDTIWATLSSWRLYKRNQGRWARQLTMAALMIIFVLSTWSLSITLLADVTAELRYAFLAIFLMVGLWFSFRIVHYPIFADFLIDVEGEMAKVSWPSKDELIRSTTVVLVTMFLLSAVLFVYDVLWQQILRWIYVLQF
ncbi:MAG: protein translocase subunit SecE [Planctomycetaceae bacterium]|nr:MAG: protein translocase subunit SecE [Planctomycetaceae bacterium]